MPDQTTDDMAEVSELFNIDVATVGLVGKAANKRRYLLFKSQEGGNETMPDERTEMTEVPDEGKLLAWLKGMFAKAEEAEEEQVTETQPVEQTPEPVTEVEKAAPVVGMTTEQVEAIVKARTDVLSAELAKARKDAEEAAALAKAEQERRIAAEYLEKAQQLVGLPTGTDELAGMLRKAATAGFEDELTAMLKAAGQTVVMSGAFDERGTTHVEKSDDLFTVAVEKKAAALQEADPTLSKTEAMSQAYGAVGRDNPALAKAYIRKRQRETGGR
jgi:hypothetical protein